MKVHLNVDIDELNMQRLKKVAAKKGKNHRVLAREILLREIDFQFTMLYKPEVTPPNKIIIAGDFKPPPPDYIDSEGHAHYGNPG